MANDETGTPTKSEKASSPAQDQPVVHAFPDWTGLQAYYGPGVPMPPPYFNAAVAPGHPPHPYMWGPQPLMPPFATPYTAIYPHGVYSHPTVVSSSSTDVPAKSSNGKGFMKKLKGFDGLAVSAGNVNADATVGDGSGQSQSGEDGGDGSSDASNENNESGGKENQRKRASADTLGSGDKKADIVNGVPIGKMNETSDSKGLNVSPSAVTSKPLSVPASCHTPGMQLSATSQFRAGLHAERWPQDERELKREKRKQSNRESARRSRLRKQAETEELAVKVESLGTENTSLRSEITRLQADAEKLRAENSSLMERLKNREAESEEAPLIVVENFLSRIDELRRDENHDNSSGGKLHQLLDSNRRTDAVAAG